ncbi:sugar phosphate isomerase/epimerase family protein [Mucilaginibacter jinjuensis]|uniref:Sugar phosphate isomerase/epimerase n=1 Tax=Mucilaginibacter jinjuensis TaxID=1176721 RepID=A0ABY7T3B2_9SPHI|nr:sugar phosphate isomerase/epimerase [Mucilaginibacter jinjuensis]WCT10876.1 sugar phosphate isomerase/epimerase [Mucilaginibacter jinjuensis]
MTTRRAFLTQAGLFATGALLMPKLTSAKIDGKAGLQLYSLREQLPADPKGVIAKIAQAGYKEVETYGYSKEHGFFGLSAKEFSNVLKANGLSTPSGHYGMDMLFAEGKFGELDEAIEAAQITGQQYVTIPYLGDKFRKTGADLKNVAAKVNLAAERAKKGGLKLAYHNHNFEFDNIDGTSLYETLAKETNVTLEMDLYWAVRSNQDPIKWFEKYPGRFHMVHVKDMDKGQPELNTEVGKGSIDFKSIFAKAKLAGIKHFIVEQENFKIDPYASITESSRYLRNVLLG